MRKSSIDEVHIESQFGYPKDGHLLYQDFARQNAARASVGDEGGFLVNMGTVLYEFVLRLDTRTVMARGDWARNRRAASISQGI